MGPTGLHPRCQQGCVPFWRLWGWGGGELIFCLLQLPETACIPWFVAPSSASKMATAGRDLRTLPSFWL